MRSNQLPNVRSSESVGDYSNRVGHRSRPLPPVSHPICRQVVLFAGHNICPLPSLLPSGSDDLGPGSLSHSFVDTSETGARGPSVAMCNLPVQLCQLPASQVAVPLPTKSDTGTVCTNGLQRSGTDRCRSNETEPVKKVLGRQRKNVVPSDPWRQAVPRPACSAETWHLKQLAGPFSTLAPAFTENVLASQTPAADCFSRGWFRQVNFHSPAPAATFRLRTEAGSLLPLYLF